MRTEDQQRQLLRERLTLWWTKGPSFPNPWISVRPVKVYVKKHPVLVNGVRYERALIISNINVTFTRQKKGWCREVFRWAEEQDADVLIAESVISPRMEEILAKNNWICHSKEEREWSLHPVGVQS